MEASLILSILALVGVGLTYWFLQEKIEKQKQRFRKRFEELEDRHESRILEIIESMQVNYQVQLKQATDELKQRFEARLQATINSLPENNQTQRIQKIDELEEVYQAQLQDTIDSLKENDENQPLEKSTENTLIDSEDNLDLPVVEPIIPEIQSVETSFVNNLQGDEPLEQEVVAPLTPEIQPTPLEIPSVSTSSANFELGQEISDPWSEETQQTPIETDVESISSAVFEPEPEIVELSIQETQPTPIETSPFSISSENIELEDEIRAQSNQEIQQEIDQALKEIIAVITPPTDAENTAQSVNPTTSKKTEDITEKVIAMGKSNQVAYIPQLTEYVSHSDSRIRELVASTLGNIAATQSQKSEVSRAIHLLGKLSRSPEPSVRQSAVEALGKIKNESVIPYLKQALRDANPNVVKLASTALNKFKFYPINQGTKPTKMPSRILKR
ncbi:PBS lyase HEAT-like repeat protein [Allocoleopsis franciscana PCC 7113]|uniref:PBS lyase HEAT-like repeat protein n=2 Tax=Allocoleopsis TaxID=2886347 RepID=K9WA92_9CYAN|nr:PBS lyase HEAT-like repeat protein [Allocoleopsis franciscana PCC 7113]